MPDIKKIETEVWEPHPEKKGWMRKVRNKTYIEIYNEIIGLLLEHKMYDKFSAFFTEKSIRMEDELPERSQFVCYAMPGFNEGSFVFVDVKTPENSKLLFMGRTHKEIEFALQVVILLTQAFYGKK